MSRYSYGHHTTTMDRYSQSLYPIRLLSAAIECQRVYLCLFDELSGVEARFFDLFCLESL